MHKCGMNDKILTDLAMHIIMSIADSTIDQSEYINNKAKRLMKITTPNIYVMNN